MLIDSSKRRGNAKKDLQKYLVEKEKTENVQLRYCYQLMAPEKSCGV
jgi:hypothetical protein